MIVAVHQPHFLPWLGYLDRMMRADVFVLLDHVQFERRNYQNRTLIRLDGKAHWLTVPVLQRSQQERILDKCIDNPANGEKRWWGPLRYLTLYHGYRQTPFFERYAPQVQAILESRWERLVDLDLALIDFLRACFDIHTPIRKSSELDVQGQRSELLLNICRVLGADTYLAGMGGSRAYLERAMFAAANVNIAWQEFRHPCYPQFGRGPFIPGLSALDLLFNCGPQGCTLLRAGTA